MKRLLLATALATAFGAPAMAADTAIIIWNTADPLGAETATGTTQASILSSNLDGITVSVSSVLKGTNPNDLTEANINIDNTTGTVQTLKIIAGANGYAGPTTGFTLTGTIGATLGGSDLVGQFFADATNSLNGQSLSVTGTLLDSFNSGALTGPQSFSFNGAGLDALLAPYGLAEELTLTLQPGASVFVQGVSMDAVNAVPEPSTWAMLIAGFGLIGALGWKRKRTPRFAV
jgi:hypothetical protein